MLLSGCLYLLMRKCLKAGFHTAALPERKMLRSFLLTHAHYDQFTADREVSCAQEAKMLKT